MSAAPDRQGREARAAREAREARDAVLRRIRTALADRPAAVPTPRDYERSLPPGTAIGELFVERVSDYRATVHRTSAEGLTATIATVVGERRAKRLAVPAGVPAGWLAGIEVERLPDDPPLSAPEIDALDGVITGCAVAIAETGTIVLDGGPGQGRRAISLVPDYHLCVIFERDIVGSVPEGVAKLQQVASRPGRPITFISGPSATSDIELNRVEGVHGPRTLEVLVVAEAP